MIDFTNKKVATVILDISRDRDGGFIPCLIIEGEPGHFPLSGQGEFSTPWNWGKDREKAQTLADERNKVQGLSKEDVKKLVFYSLFPDGEYNRVSDKF